MIAKMKLELERNRPIILGALREWLITGNVPSHAELLERWGTEFLSYRLAWRTFAERDDSSREREYALHELRWEAIAEFGFVLPCRELLVCLATQQPILEIGAGTGYMTALMKTYGIDVVGTDPSIEQHWFETGRHADLVPMQAKTAIRHWKHVRPTVFCSWPSYQATWFRQALKAMAVGQSLVIVREDATADDSTWDYLDQCFALENSIAIPTWPFLHDIAEVRVKKRQRAPWN